jgi:hypothetical protein
MDAGLHGRRKGLQRALAQIGKWRATTAASKCSKEFAYSITSSARAITEAGTVIPSALAV